MRREAAAGVNLSHVVRRRKEASVTAALRVRPYGATRVGECQGLKRQPVKGLDLHGGREGESGEASELDCARVDPTRLSFSFPKSASNCPEG